MYLRFGKPRVVGWRGVEKLRWNPYNLLVLRLLTALEPHPCAKKKLRFEVIVSLSIEIVMGEVSFFN